MTESTDNLPTEVKWRESKYLLTKVNDDGKVEWFNPVSRHRATCSVEAWKRSDPYDMANK